MNDDLSKRLSAYIDGELEGEQALEIEALLASDEAVQEEMDALLLADASAQADFEKELDTPVPFDLAKMIMTADLKEETLQPAQKPRGPIWGALAAGLAMFMIGGLGGYAYKGQIQSAEPKGWIAAIAEYHAVYAGQSRHLVEVSAEETDHIETWLGSTIGAEFIIPDLTAHGLTFEGGRLVVANGKPVAQLMYTDVNGLVVALCLQSSSKTAPAPFSESTNGDFDFVSWSDDGADHVIIGPSGQLDLIGIAGTAALEI
ncbi:anti-sigma factor [Octadecabacter sp. CECT 8868]|uniref:anti-sigma factor family protein n=1 Tax=Octadecabacter algicola TaxID=2909342 RepID=UPI001F2F854F|nr:anti-sigma factor [Octadecabacter algicola]MCF2905922.1 anti-sigma factor [Octadecabacter algicola]